MISLWSDKSIIPEFSSLNGEIKTHTLIIGGGITGILCALLLSKAGIEYCLVEGDRICTGITKNTTAKITAQHGLIYDKLIKNAGIENAEKYYRVNDEALKYYTKLCKNIDCDFENKDAYVYSLNNRKKAEKEVIALQKIGVKSEFCNMLPLPFEIAGAVRLPNQAQFNPLKFLSAVSKDLKIYENTFVKEIKGNVAFTERGNITADNIIVTTHFPFMNKYGAYFLKMYQHRSYAIAYKNAVQLDGMYVDEALTGMSFRNYKDFLIIGGGDHRTGKNGGCFEEIRNFQRKYYPKAEEKYFWATQDCMTLDGIPYIGKYSRSLSNVYVASGFNKWGMTSAMAAAMILCDMVSGKQNEFESVFCPQRSILKPQLLANGFEATAGLLSFSKKRCPHLGCALKWNSLEHSWDCPCHGSRFDKNGKLIDNPATGDLKK